MSSLNLPSLDRYQRQLKTTAEWLLRSIDNGRGGSCAHLMPIVGWSRPYPETTGYLIPTLLELESWLPGMELAERARGLGDWLAGIQQPEGYWFGGLHPPRSEGKPSVFNTGQILLGLVALYDHSDDSRWLDAARRGATWMAEGVGDGGLWRHVDYRASSTPSYYTHAAWPMLEVWKRTGETAIGEAAGAVLDAVVTRRQDNGAFRGWAFEEGKPAFTHTIAYTLWGLLASAELVGDWSRFGEPTVQALELLTRRAELAGGRLPGAFDERWKKAGDYVCLTGNAQIALCLLLWEARAPDLRLVNAAAKLVDFVCDVQSNTIGSRARGAVAGSHPLWGPYMRMRYPNWAAKYHCDALVRLVSRLRSCVDETPTPTADRRI